MDNFGWTEQDTVMYFGIMMACNGFATLLLFLSVGPMCKRFDERKLMIFVGVLGFMIGRFFCLPIPGFPLPPLKPDHTGIVGRSSYMTHGLPYISRYDQHESHFRITHFNSSNLGIHNVPCQEVVGEPGCDLEWCKRIPALTVWQFILGWAASNFGLSYGMAIGAALFSKVIGPRPQVVQLLLTIEEVQSKHCNLIKQNFL